MKKMIIKQSYPFMAHFMARYKKGHLQLNEEIPYFQKEYIPEKEEIKTFKTP